MAKGRKKKIQEEVKPIEEQAIDLTAPAQEDEPQLESAGIGDTVEKLTSLLGIQKCAKCEERRKKFNKAFPFLNHEKMDKLEGKDVEVMKRVLATTLVENDDANAIFEMYNRIYKPRPQVKRCMCPGLFRKLIERLEYLMPDEE